jgi:hypothetical protein
MKRGIVKGIGLLLLLVVLVVSGRDIAAAQTNTPKYFPETRHSVRGDFLRYWQTLREPLSLLGYPITDEFLDPINGRPTQYFQRGRLDGVLKDGVQVVQQANLGSLLYDGAGIPANVSETGPLCRQVPTTRFAICYAFLQFYDQNDGPKFIGNPVSGLEIRDGRIVQYFQKMRLEWQPSRPSGQRVVVSQLGRLAFDKYIGDASRLNPSSDDPIVSSQSNITALTARAFVSRVLAPVGVQQSVYVIVQDQDFHPVKGAQVSLTVIYPGNNRVQIRSFELTSAEGFLVVHFPVGVAAVKEVVQLEVTTELQGLKATTTSWFRIWY